MQEVNLGGDRRKLQECSGEGKEAQREHVVEQMAIVGNRDSLLLGASGAGVAVERTSEWPHAQVGAPMHSAEDCSQDNSRAYQACPLRGARSQSRLRQSAGAHSGKLPTSAGQEQCQGNKGRTPIRSTRNS